MPVAFSVEPAANLFVIKLEGQTNPKEIDQAYASGIAQADYQQNMDCIWDIDGIKLSQFSVSEVRELTSLLRQYSAKRGADYKVGIVTDNAGDLQLLRVYTTFIKLVGSFRMKVFRDLDKAKQWLQED